MPVLQREVELLFMPTGSVSIRGEGVIPCLSQPAITNSAGAAVFLNDSREVMVCRTQ